MHGNVMVILFVKAVKILARKRSILTLVVVSSGLTFGLLYLMWYLSRHEQLHFMTSDGYDKLQFTLVCDADDSESVGNLHCVPDAGGNSGHNKLSTSQLFFQSIAERHTESAISVPAAQLASLLSSIMMNGLPLLGLDDFVYFSDLVNSKLSDQVKEALMSTSEFKHKFSNFLDVRNHRLFFYPDNFWVREFVANLRNKTTTFQSLQAEVFPTEARALQHCCHHVWAVIRMVAPDTATTSTSGVVAEPEVTIRMHPAAVPDTRNYEYSPLNRHLLSRQEAGQLLYFTSGFLTLQLEIQNFLAARGLGGDRIQSDVFSGRNGRSILQPALAAHDLAEKVARATSSEEVRKVVRGAAQVRAGERPSLLFPVFHRAFPTHNNQQSLFWHTFGALTTVGLVLYFSLPAAITAGELSRERVGGQLDVLSTLPGVRYVHSLLGWAGAAALWVVCAAALTWVFFALVLQHTSPLLPTFALLLLGIALNPVALLLSEWLGGPDSVVGAVPSLVFITLLPGLLYFELAFDVQRTLTTELALCLLPPSAAALILRTVCGYEAINAGASWTTTSAIAGCPMYAYLLMLVLDILLYSGLMLVWGMRKDMSAGGGQQHVVSGCWAIADWVTNLCGPATGVNSQDEVEADVELARLLGDQHRAEETNTELPALMVRGLTKVYHIGTSEVTVLSDINANLPAHGVTLLLGSNGAGKTTLMRVLTGLDRAYSGQVTIPGAVLAGAMSRRLVGWCPQGDCLYDQLTVREHLQMVMDLVCSADGTGGGFPESARLLPAAWVRWWRRLTCQAAMSNQRQRHEQHIDTTLRALDMLSHCNKRVSELSGGMKRRLSLSLAFQGDPAVLFLDEPTSGCDMLTRELVCKDILSRRGGSAILISTHHTDDVEVLADRVWFLSDRYLEVDEAVENLAAWRSSQVQRPIDPTIDRNGKPASSVGSDTNISGCSTELASSCGAQAIEFSTYDVGVKNLFEDAMGQDRAASWIYEASSSSVCVSTLGSEAASHRNTTTAWMVPVNCLPLLRRLVSRLEGEGLHCWSLNTCSTYSMLCHLYDQERNHTADAADAGVRNDFVRPARWASHRSNSGWQPAPEGEVTVFVRHLRAILWVRCLELWSSKRAFVLGQLLLPILVAFAISWGCRDVVYPKTEIASADIGGVGEMCIADDHDHSSGAINTAPSPLEGALNAQFGLEHVNWVGKMGSDAMWKRLFHTYYTHPLDRWAAFVVQDVVPEWIASAVVLQESALQVDPQSVRAACLQAQQEVCPAGRDTAHYSDPGEGYDDDAHDDDGNYRRPSASIALCGDVPALSVDFFDGFGDGDAQPAAIKITSYESMRANVTMLSNVTTDHAAPIYLKEVVPVVVAAQHRLSLDSDFNATGQVLRPQYHLYSHPLPLTNQANEVYLQRGHLGSTIVVLFLLMTTSTCVRSVIKQRTSGAKTQLYLAGLHPTTFWLANFLMDATLCAASLGAAMLGVWVGGAPIASYFFASSADLQMLLFLTLVTYSAAVVASSHVLVVHSHDPLAAQMVLLVSGVASGMFLKLYLDRHVQDGGVYRVLDGVFLYCSPSFTFTSALFDLLTLHVLQVSAAALGQAETDLPTRLIRRVRQCVAILLGQAAVYVALCVVREMYEVKVFAWARRLRWRQTQGSTVQDQGSEPDNLLQQACCKRDQFEEGVRSVGPAVVEARRVVVQYPRLRKLALDHVTFAIKPGERVALVGQNGGGKSTLFRTLALAENSPVSGTLTVGGLDAVDEVWRIGSRNLVGYVPQEGGLFEFLTVEETLQLFAQLQTPVHGSPAPSGAVSRSREEAHLIPERYGAYPVRALSGGTRKKLALFVASCRRPALLMVDEGTTGVDPIAAERMVRYLKRTLRPDKQSLLFASHRLEESLATCDRVLLLQAGRVRVDAPISALYDLAHRCYQVDITLPDNKKSGPPSSPGTGDSTEDCGLIPDYGSMGRRAPSPYLHSKEGSSEERRLEAVLAELFVASGVAAVKTVHYSAHLARLTLSRAEAPLSPLWDCLAGMQEKGIVRSYAFRSVALEEAMAVLPS